MATDETPEAARQDEVDTLLDHLRRLKEQQRTVEAELADKCAELTELLEAGEIDPSFAFNDWNFSYSQGRITTTYSNGAKATIKRIQEADVATGNARQKLGNGFWTIKPPSL